MATESLQISRNLFSKFWDRRTLLFDRVEHPTGRSGVRRGCISILAYIVVLLVLEWIIPWRVSSLGFAFGNKSFFFSFNCFNFLSQFFWSESSPYSSYYGAYERGMVLGDARSYGEFKPSNLYLKVPQRQDTSLRSLDGSLNWIRTTLYRLVCKSNQASESPLKFFILPQCQELRFSPCSTGSGSLFKRCQTKPVKFPLSNGRPSQESREDWENKIEKLLSFWLTWHRPLLIVTTACRLSNLELWVPWMDLWSGNRIQAKDKP